MECWKNGEDAGGSQDGRSIWHGLRVVERTHKSNLPLAPTALYDQPAHAHNTSRPCSPPLRPCAFCYMLRALLNRNRRSSSATLPAGGWWGKFGGKGGGKKETPPPPPPPPPAPMTPAAAPNMALTRQRLLTLVFGDMETVRMVCTLPQCSKRVLISTCVAPSILCCAYDMQRYALRGD